MRWTATTRKVRATVMDADAMRRSLERVAHEIVERNKGVDHLVVVGIVRQGDVLAQRLAAMLSRMEGCSVPFGQVNPARHRDDLHLRPLPEPASHLETEVPPLDGQTVVLVDDVIWHGRTARAAMDALLEYGRPRAIQLAVLIDRGHRELPIRPDFVGKNVPTSAEEMISVCLADHEGVDAVVILA